MTRRAALALAAALLVAACSPSSAGQRSAGGPGDPASRVRVAAAADLRYAMDELIARWTSTEPGIAVEPAYGSSGTFVAQISAGAPFDVFFSADAEYPRELERAGLAEPGSTRLYAIGRIVLWVAAASAIDVESGLAALADDAVDTVAIANPEHAPYGRAAVAALRSAGVYNAVAPKLVLGENVSQAAQFVESGNADAGLIALSLAAAPGLRDAGRYAVVPIDSYPSLEQGAVVLGSGARADAARTFLDFVLGPDGRTVLDRYGFLPPPP